MPINSEVHVPFNNNKVFNGLPLKVLEDLGMQYPLSTSTTKTHFAMFECPRCANPFRASINNIKRGMQVTCSVECGAELFKVPEGPLSQETLKELVEYEPLTGKFTRKVKWALRHTVGEELHTKAKGGDYLKAGIGGKEYLLHRLAFLYMTGDWPAEVDHKDHNGCNNAWDNLRDVNGFINHQNMSKSTRNTSGVVGVSFDNSTNRWHAQIMANGEQLSKKFITKFGAIRQRILWNREFNFHKNHGKELTIIPAEEDFYHQSIGVYYTQTFKTKPSTTFLLSMNKWNTSHHFLRNAIKQYYNDAFVLTIQAAKYPKIKGKYEVAYMYYYKNVKSDLTNVCSLISKFFLDAAVKAGLTEEDTVAYCVKETFMVAEQDKDNPRVEIFIRSLKETDESL